MDVAGAVRQHVGGAHAYDELGLGVRVEQRVAVVDGREPVHAQPARAREVDEQETDLRVVMQVSEGEVRPVPVVVREGERVLVDHPHETGVAALVRALRHAVLVGGREEEHLHPLDEGAVALVEEVPVEALLDAVGEAPCVEPVLQGAVAGVVEAAHSWMMRFVRPAVHISAPVPLEVEEALRRDFEVVPEPQGADGIVAMLTVTVDDAYLAAAGPQLRVLANYAVGVNNVDVEAARRRGVVVANTPDVLTGATAELALTLMLSLLRRVAEGDRFVRRRAPWQFSLEFMLGERLAGKTLLVVGAGRIGRETARLAEAFGARPVFAGRTDDLDALLPGADIVSLHVPLTDDTRHLIDARRLRLMKPAAVLINTARGPVVDEAALAGALRDGVIAGAGLDVYEHEPEVNEALLSLENVVLAPHLGSATRDTRIAMGMLCVEALRAVLLEGRTPANVVA